MNFKTTVAVAGLLMLLPVGSVSSFLAQEPQPSPRHFLVLMRLGPSYDRALPIRQQKGFPAHVTYMSQLESKGQLAFGGPLLEDFSSMKPTGGVLVVRAQTAEEARAIAGADPSGLLQVEEVRAFLLSAGSK